MVLSTIDWVLIISFFIISLFIGLVVSRKAGSSSQEFFLSGRNMPWWLLGVSMVATTFSADTPNLVTDIVRKDGVSGNWVWWAFLLTGMLTVFVYAKLWRRSEVLTDLEFYELRYSGKNAAFLRGFRAIYLGVFFNIMIMATVSLAAIKIGGVMLGLEPWQTLLFASIVTVIYSSLGGLRGVLITDFFQFVIAMTGTVWAANVILDLPQVNGLSNLLSHESVVGKLSFVPDFSDTETFITLLIIPLAVQWWSVWYPGAEPGGGGYIAQRMLSAKSEKHAIGATLFFNAAHYALRPWPWILIALASLIVFPDIASLREAFPNVDPSVVKDDLAYSAMLTYLPSGLLGLVLASLIAAFMSTISTHLNWGSSYVVYDFYKRFVNTEASDKELVNVGRISTVLLMVVASILALFLKNALQAFNILLQIGAGTGLLFILRWFWWRVNAMSEITAMVVSFFMALYLQLIHTGLGFEPLPNHYQLIIGIIVTTISWVSVALFTKPDDDEVLINFCKKVKAGGPGWARVTAKAKDRGETWMEGMGKWSVPREISLMIIGSLTIYAALFATGLWIYGEYTSASITSAGAIVGGFLLMNGWNKLNAS
ncbi:sodium:solute symporter family protein [Flammeovirgaceae bacterium SG7u.111]|nr:sodium:solute symporter family protein [Flammeovirgaceae bacterium SG7u.132]WPO34083.1 sodium:solute symporter family protein [Flammeovirgaceae bacterium SG7u.111]